MNVTVIRRLSKSSHEPLHKDAPQGKTTNSDRNMLTIQIIAPACTKTIMIEEVTTDDVIIYRPCVYCGKVLVRAPAKYCSKSHKVLACIYRINRQG